MFFRKKPAPPSPIDAIQQLALVPLRNAAVRTIEDTPERIVLGLTLVYPPWMGPVPRWLGLSQERRFKLYELGLWTWRRIDDRITFGELIEALALEQQLGFNEARLLLITYLRQLSVKGLAFLGDVPEERRYRKPEADVAGDSSPSE